MRRRLFRTVCVCLVTSGLLHIGVRAGAAEAAAAATIDKLPPPVQWLDPQTVAVLELVQPKPLLAALLDPKTTKAIESQPVYKQVANQPQFRQFVQVVRLLEATCGTDWRSGLQKLLGGGLVAAVDAGGGLVIVIDSQDQKLLEDVHRVLLEIAKAEAARQGQPERVASKQYRGVTAWTFGGGEAHALIGSRLLLANRAESLRAVLDLRADPSAKSLAAHPGYQAARRAAGDAAAMAYLNTAAMRDTPQMRQAIEQLCDPWLALMVPGAGDVVARSDWLAASFRADGQRIVLTALADKGHIAGATPFCHPQKPDEGPLPLPRIPGQIAGVTLYRDLYRFYAAKDELFPQRTSGLIFFENMMGIFFSGRDLTEEVLKQLGAEVRLVAARQQFDPAVGTPEPQLPAFAAVFRLRDPAQFAEVVEEAWQKAFGLVSVTRGQKAEPGLILDRVTHRGVKFTVAYFSLRGHTGKGPLDVRFNFRPALAMPDQWVILSSTEALARDLIDALAEAQRHAKQPPPAASGVPQGAHTVVELDAGKLAELLRLNRDSLVRQQMIEQGKTQAEAIAEQQLLTFLLQCAGQVRLALGGSDKHTLGVLEITPQLPQSGPELPTR